MERLLTVQELADRLQIKPRTVYQWVHESYIPVIKLGSLVRFSPARVAPWLEVREVSGRAPRRLAVDLP